MCGAFVVHSVQLEDASVFIRHEFQHLWKDDFALQPRIHFFLPSRRGRDLREPPLSKVQQTCSGLHEIQSL